jgi:hypothetical protein
MSAFGTDFVILNDVCQPLQEVRFPDGPAIHHATIKRGLKEYIVFRQASSNKIYIEEVERHRATFVLKRIEDDAEWADIARFAEAAGLTNMGSETKHAN